MGYIENKTFDEIQIGDTAEISRSLTMNIIQAFAVISGDVNPAHLDKEYAKDDMFHHIVGHGMWTASLISTVLGTKLPGPGTIYLSQTLCFMHPVQLGDVITARVEVIEKNWDKPIITLACECNNQENERVLKGKAEVLAPIEKVKRERVVLPGIELTDDN